MRVRFPSIQFWSVVDGEAAGLKPSLADCWSALAESSPSFVRSVFAAWSSAPGTLERRHTLLLRLWLISEELQQPLMLLRSGSVGG